MVEDVATLNAKARSVAKADGNWTDIESVTEGSCDDGFVVFVGCSKRTGEDSELGVGLDEAKLLHEARVTDDCSTAKRVGLGEALRGSFRSGSCQACKPERNC